MQRPARAHPSAELFRTSFLVLYLELALIRWCAAYVPYAAFFSNHVLLGALLGTALGFLLAGRAGGVARAAPLALLATVAAAAAFHVLHARGLLAVRVDDPRDPDELFFGTIWPTWSARHLALPIEATLVAIFSGVAVAFAGLGQVLGRRFDRHPGRLAAYAVHLAGGVAGVLAFTAVSALGLAPPWWLAPALALVALDCGAGWRGRAALAAAWLAVLVIELEPAGWRRVWSPYERIDFEPARGLVFANGIGHQRIAEAGRTGLAYRVPYRLLEVAGEPVPRRVLVVGAGTGNDVALALAAGARSVDAVEIDPAILALGAAHHPDRPYADARVAVHADDGRAFLSRSDGRWDMVVYGLVDSLTRQSSYASLRLESYLFTREAVELVRAHLADDGIFVVYNYMRSGWLVARLERLLAEAFGAAPLVISIPPRAEIRGDAPPDDAMTVLVAGHVAPLAAALAARPSLSSDGGGEEAVELAASAVVAGAPARVPTDDWPYPYLRAPRVPPQNLRALALLLAASAAIALALRAPLRAGLDRHFFFLGAGFALVETASIARMAVLFGTTWQVHAAVVAGIFVASLAGTALAAVAPRLGARTLYALLALALVPAALAPTPALLALPAAARWPAAAALLFAPALASGAIFARSLARLGPGAPPHRALGSNTAGLVLGAGLECLSVVTGLRGLAAGIALLYAASFRAD